MLRIFQRSLSLRPLLPGGVDAHCHLLPGVDDGADTPEESLAIIRGQQALGLRGAICTPHIMARLPQNTPAYLRTVFEKFVSSTSPEATNSTPRTSHFACLGVESEADASPRSRILRTSEGPFALHLAAEYMLDEAFPRHLASGDLLTIDSSLICPTTSGEIENPKFNIQDSTSSIGQSTQQYLLVELPQYLLPPGWQDMLDGILAAGITPLLAHPERYLRILDERDICALVDRGIALQGNLGSLTGYYGSRVKTLAQSLLADKLYTTFGTDSHSAHMLHSLKLAA